MLSGIKKKATNEHYVMLLILVFVSQGISTSSGDIWLPLHNGFPPSIAALGLSLLHDTPLTKILLETFG